MVMPLWYAVTPRSDATSFVFPHLEEITPVSEILVVSFWVVLWVTWVQGLDEVPTPQQITNISPTSSRDLGSLFCVSAPWVPGCQPLPHRMRLVPYLAEQTLPTRGLCFLREWWPGDTRVKLLETFPVCLVCSGVAFRTLSSQLHLPLPHGENRDSLCLISQTTLSLHKGKDDCRKLLIHLCASQGTYRRVWQEDVMFVSRGAWSSGEGNIDCAGLRGENCWSVVCGLMKEVGLVHK